MKFNRNLFAVLLVAVFMLASSSFAQDSMKHGDAMKKDSMKKDAVKHDDAIAIDSMAMEEDARPIVAMIGADWCPYCKNVDPVVSSLMPDYGKRLNFVMFDVTNDKTIAASKEKAEKLGLSKFFEENKKKTSTVAVLKDKKVVYKTTNNSKKADYVKAFDEALQ